MTRKVIKIFCAAIFIVPSLSFAQSPNGASLGFTIKEIFNAPQPKLELRNVNSSARWMEESTAGRETPEFEIFYQVSSNRVFGYSYQSLEGIHKGEATVYRCIVSLCAFFGDSIVSGLTANDTIKYRADQHSLWSKFNLKIVPYLEHSVKIGLSLVDSQISVEGNRKEIRKSGVIPAPEIGLQMSLPIASRSSIGLEFAYRHLGYRGFKTQYTYSGLTIKTQILNSVEIGLGALSRSWVYSYDESQKSTVSGRLAVSQDSPFIQLTIRH